MKSDCGCLVTWHSGRFLVADFQALKHGQTTSYRYAQECGESKTIHDVKSVGRLIVMLGEGYDSTYRLPLHV